MSERVARGVAPIFDEDGAQGLIGFRDSAGRNWMVPRFTTNVSGNVTGMAGPNGALAASAWLSPSGNDDAARISEFVQDTAASGLEARIGPGDFIIGSPMTWRSRRQITKWGGQGIGLRVFGQGPGNTRFFYSGASGSPMLWINAPTSAGIAKRNYMTELGGMSWLRATSETTQNAIGTTSGAAFYAVPVAELLEVFHTVRLRDLYIDGFDFPITLSDCTLGELDTVWANEFLTGVRLGYNCDILKIRHSMFGSEQFGVTYRNNAIAIQTGFNDGFNSTLGANIVELEHIWFMKIGKAFEGADIALSGLRFSGCYFEDVRQYFHHTGSTSVDSVVSFDKCHFSQVSTNDTTQSNPTLGGYQAKIQFDGDISVNGGKRPVLSVRDCTADQSQPANAWVSFNARNGYVSVENTTWRTSAAFGHVRCIRSTVNTWRSIPPDAGAQGGVYQLGDSNQGGLGLLHSTPIEVIAAISSGATYNIDANAGTVFYLTLPDGDCTINTLAFGVPPNVMISTLTKIKVILIVPATVGATRTITWGSRLRMPASTLTYSAANQNHRAVLMFEGYSNSGSVLQLVSAGPTLVS